MNRIETIESSRLKFNVINPNDIDFLYQYYSDPDLTKFLPSGEPYPKNKVVELLGNRIKHWNMHHFGTYLLSLKTSGENIGYCGLEYVKDTEFIDIRYGVTTEHWGKGFAKEASIRSIESGFNDLGLSIIYGAAVPENIASIEILKKIGMKPYEDGNFYDDVVEYYKIEKSDF